MLWRGELEIKRADYNVPL